MDLGGGGPAFQFMNSWGGRLARPWAWSGSPSSRSEYTLPRGPTQTSPEARSTRVIEKVWAVRYAPAVHALEGSPESPTCEPCRAGRSSRSGDVYFGPPEVDRPGVARRRARRFRCGEVPVSRAADSGSEDAPDPDKPGSTRGPIVRARPRSRSSAARARGRTAPRAADPADSRRCSTRGSATTSARCPRPRGSRVAGRRQSPTPVDEKTTRLPIPLRRARRRTVAATAEIGPDPAAIGAWEDRARFEITDEKVVSDEPIRASASKSSYPGDDRAGRSARCT